jgi:Rod binding domain-containing protein
VKTDGPGGGGSGESIFRSLMIQDIGRQLATQSGIGLADSVKREMLAMQEVRAK